jgi:hypothetical protein
MPFSFVSPSYIYFISKDYRERKCLSLAYTFNLYEIRGSTSVAIDLLILSAFIGCL